MFNYDFSQRYNAIDATLPSDLNALDDFISERENSVSGLKPGTEKTIVWEDPQAKTRKDYSIVYLHGFSATRQELDPVALCLAQRMGANLFYTRLSGHGQDGEALSRAELKDWLDDAIEAFAVGQRIGANLIIIGVSTGATLAAIIAGQDSLPNPSGLIFISPNFGLKNQFFRLLKWSIGRTIVKFIRSHRSFSPYNERHAYFWTTSYPIEALFTLSDLMDLFKKGDLNHITSPILCLYDEYDNVINVKLIKKALKNQKKDAKLQPFNYTQDPEHHILGGDIISPSSTKALIDEIFHFLSLLFPVIKPESHE